MVIMTAGYSKRPLADKLGIKEGSRILVLNAPRDYTSMLDLPPCATVTSELKGPFEFVHFFAKSRSNLETRLPALKRELLKTGMIWISWPKGSSGVKSELNEGVVREVGLKNGLVDTKVCAVDEVWSGLKFVYRKSDRV
jgi:hypothetical protein